MFKNLKKIISLQSRFAKKSVYSKNSVNITSTVANKNLLSNYELYIKNSCVRRSVNLIASSVSSIKFKIMKDAVCIKNHFLYDFLNTPNYNDSWSSFLEAFVTNYLIFGNAFLFLDKECGKLKLYNLQSDKVKVVPGHRGVPDSFVYTVDEKNYTYNNDSEFPFIGYLKNYNPCDHWYGSSVLDSVYASANLHQSITANHLSVMSNGGRPSGVVTLKSGSEALTENQKKELTNSLNAAYSGPNNAGKIIFIEGGDFSWQPMSNPADMDYVNAKVLAAREISEALGVPSILIGGIGMDGESAKSNFKEITQRFHEGTILPLANKIFGFLNNWLVQKIDSSVKLEIDLDEFLPIDQKRFAFWDKINSASFLTDNEKRSLLGFDNLKFTADEASEKKIESADESIFQDEKSDEICKGNQV